MPTPRCSQSRRRSALPDAFDEVIGSLRAAGVPFDTFEAEELTWDDGVGQMEDMRSVVDPDGNILNVETRLA